MNLSLLKEACAADPTTPLAKVVFAAVAYNEKAAEYAAKAVKEIEELKLAEAELKRQIAQMTPNPDNNIQKIVTSSYERTLDLIRKDIETKNEQLKKMSDFNAATGEKCAKDLETRMSLMVFQNEGKMEGMPMLKIGNYRWRGRLLTNTGEGRCEW